MALPRRKKLAQLQGIQTRSKGPSSISASVRPLPKTTPTSELIKQQRAESTMQQQLRAYGATQKEASDDRNFLEKALNLRNNQGFFGDAFEVLSRPQQTVVGAGMSENPFEGAWKGFSGQKHFTGEEVGKSLGLIGDDSPRWLKTLTGFGVDMATDPLAYTNAPFKWAGKGIKSLGKKGYEGFRSVLSGSERGRKIIQNIESGFDRLASVTKSSFGLWKDPTYKGFKNDLLNKVNQRLTSTDAIGTTLRGVRDDVEAFVNDIHNNPAKYIKEREALGLGAEASEEEIRKAVNEDLMNHLESTRNENLSKADVYRKLGTQSDENGAGRFLLAGEDTEGQAKAIIRQVKKDYKLANGRPLREDELSFTNGFINASPEVAAFLRRTVANYENISNRLSLFGIEGRLEGALQTLGRSGSVTFDINDAAERALVQEIARRFGGKAKVRFGAGTASVSLSQKEFRELMSTRNVRDILENSRELARERRQVIYLEDAIEKHKARAWAVNQKGAEAEEKLWKQWNDNIEEKAMLENKIDELKNDRFDLEEEIRRNKKVIGTVDNKLIRINDTKKMGQKFEKIYNTMLESLPGIRDILPETAIQNMVKEITTSEEVKSIASFTGGTGTLGISNRELVIKYLSMGNNLEQTISHEIWHALDSAIGHTTPLLNNTPIGSIYGRQEINRGSVALAATRVNFGVNPISDTFFENNIIVHMVDDMVKRPSAWKEEIAALRLDNPFIEAKTDKEFITKYRKEMDDAVKRYTEPQEVTSLQNLSMDQIDEVLDRTGLFRSGIDPEEMMYMTSEELDTLEGDTLLDILPDFDNDINEVEKFIIEEIGEEEYREILSGFQVAPEDLMDYHIYENFVDSESNIVKTIAKNIGSQPETLTSGPVGEYLSEIGSRSMFSTFRRNGDAKKYGSFLDRYLNDTLGIKFVKGRTIKGEVVALNREAKKLDGRLNGFVNRQGKLQDKLHANMIKTQKAYLKAQGSAQTLEERNAQLIEKIGKQQKTIDKVVKKTDMNLTAESTNRDLATQMGKPAENRVNLDISVGTQKEVQHFNAELKRWRAFNDESFYKVKMAESVLFNVSEDFRRISSALEGTKQQVYGMISDIYAAPGTDLAKVVDSLNVDGYMRHVVDPDVIIYKEIKRLKDGGKFHGDRARNLISRLSDSNARFFERTWLGSATDINKRLGVELFNTNPVESTAVLLKLLPEHFEVTNLFQSAFESNLIRNLGTEEASAITAAIEEYTNIGMNVSQARNEAFKQVLPKEFTLVDSDVKKKLMSSFDFLEKGGAQGAEIEALRAQIARIDESQGMIIHKGLLNQIHRYGKQLKNQDVRVILNNVKKYFVNPFKSLATLSVGFHVRNNITNITNAYLAGMGPTEYIPQFTRATQKLTSIERTVIPKLQRMVRKGGEEIKTIKGQLNWIEKNFTKTEKELLNKMQEWQAKGVMGVNRFSSDVEEILNGIRNKSQSGLFMSKFRTVTEASMKIGKLSDDASKIAAYEWAKNTKKGKAMLASHAMKEPEEFSKFVFFDYTDLTDFEQRYMKSIFPFYTWTRKNIEFQIKNFFQNSHKYVRMNKAITAWQSYVAGDDPDNLSRWDKEQMLIPISNSNGEITFLKVSPGFLDVSETYKNPLNKISPLIKAPLESWSGTNFFSGQKVNTGPFGQFSQEMFGDFGELGKAFRGEDFDKSKSGLVGKKVLDLSNAGKSISKGDLSPTNLLPSVFRKSNIEQTRASNIRQRVRESRAYIKQLQAGGRKPDARLLPRRRRRMTGFTRSGNKFNI